ncbi:hypothetical protein SISSUDRAFT_1044519 [Sistotremastrum suecicum HHB10207 ss-3]|uniref:Uncharacterized protein n=1 Tax=Sistotremastrum suecicum HHB10207 ss-3 TaxID=1314776 RepID=A0A166F4L2_9AGAM|nr:hypothetical protein SISSUDRAFT_1044519 [Sistotremastrum suecicum HHB10207 ss-3]
MWTTYHMMMAWTQCHRYMCQWRDDYGSYHPPRHISPEPTYIPISSYSTLANALLLPEPPAPSPIASSSSATPEPSSANTPSLVEDSPSTPSIDVDEPVAVLENQIRRTSSRIMKKKEAEMERQLDEDQWKQVSSMSLSARRGGIATRSSGKKSSTKEPVHVDFDRLRRYGIRVPGSQETTHMEG